MNMTSNGETYARQTMNMNSNGYLSMADDEYD